MMRIAATVAVSFLVAALGGQADAGVLASAGWETGFWMNDYVHSFGWIIGAPLLGAVSDRLGRRKPVILAGAAVLLVCLAVILYGPHGVFPPFSMVDSDGTAKGVEPDIAREMCKRMNVECEIIVMDFKALIPSLLQGKFDILISQLLPTAERKEKLTLSRALFKNPSTFIVPVDSKYTFTKEGLKDLLSLQAKLVTIENIQKTVADYYKVRMADLLSKRRSRSVARPRQVAMALAKELTSHSLPEIGDAFGGRDHTTVLHACKRIKELRDLEQRIKEDYSNLLRTLAG